MCLPLCLVYPYSQHHVWYIKVFNKHICWINEEVNEDTSRHAKGCLTLWNSCIPESRGLGSLMVIEGWFWYHTSLYPSTCHNPSSSTSSIICNHLHSLFPAWESMTVIHPSLHLLVDCLTRFVILIKGVFKAMKIKDVVVMKLLKDFHYTEMIQ